MKNNICQEQHGFVRNKSTVSNLMIYSNFIFDATDAGEQTDVIYTDFQKAFDKVNHAVLLDKLAFNGIKGNLLRWFISYLSNRLKMVSTYKRI